MTDWSERVRAGYAIVLASTFKLWVHRRVESFEFPNADTVRHRMSVDFTLPADRTVRPGDRVDVPLMILKREVLRNFDVMDEEGTRLKVLTAEENGRLAVAGLRKFLAPVWTGEPRSLLELLERLIGIDEEAHPDRDRRAKDARQTLEGGISADGSDAVAALLNLVADLETGFLLLVPLEYQPQRRRLIKFSYDAALVSRGLDRSARVYRWLTQAGSSLGLFPRRENFEDIQVGWAESYHVEVSPPADTRVAEAVLSLGDGGTKRDSSDRLLRPHLAVRERAGNAAAELTLLLHPKRDVLVLPLLLAAAVIALVLIWVPQYRASLDAQTLGALLLVPFALSAFYVRPGEHTYVTRAIQNLRLVAAVPVVSGVLVLALLALGPLKETCNEGALIAAQWAARASVGAAYLLLIAFIVPTAGKPARAVVRVAQSKAVTWKPAWRYLVSTGLALVFVLPPAAVGWWVYSLLPF